jgi:hypothetical protein
VAAILIIQKAIVTCSTLLTSVLERFIIRLPL